MSDHDDPEHEHLRHLDGLKPAGKAIVGVLVLLLAALVLLADRC